MDFNFSEEQLQLQDAITRFVQGDYDFEHHRKVVASADGWDRKAWQGLADLGVLAMIVPEDQGASATAPSRRSWRCRPPDRRCWPSRC